MFQTLRIVFTILSAICIAAVIPVGVIGGLTAFIVCAGLAFAFFLAMLYFKGRQEQTNPETAPTPDFLTPEANPETNSEEKRSERDK